MMVCHVTGNIIMMVCHVTGGMSCDRIRMMVCHVIGKHLSVILTRY